LAFGKTTQEVEGGRHAALARAPPHILKASGRLNTIPAGAADSGGAGQTCLHSTSTASFNPGRQSGRSIPLISGEWTRAKVLARRIIPEPRVPQKKRISSTIHLGPAALIRQLSQHPERNLQNEMQSQLNQLHAVCVARGGECGSCSKQQSPQRSRGMFG